MQAAVPQVSARPASVHMAGRAHTLPLARLAPHVHRQHTKLYAPGTAVTRLSAISRISESAQANHYQAAALDAAQQLGPAGQLTAPAQSHASTRWQRVLQQQQHASSIPHEYPAETIKDNLVSQHKAQKSHHRGMHAVTAAAAGQRHIHAAFGAFFGYLALMAAATTNPDWYLDVLTFGGLWGILWVVCAKLQPSASTVSLLNLLPVMHLSGALGMYHWELGNLSWDVLVHITNGFLGTLLFAAVLNDMTAASNTRSPSTPAKPAPAEAEALSATAEEPEVCSAVGGPCQVPGVASSSSAGQLQHSWQERAWGVVKVTALLLLSTALIEVVEAAGGQMAGHAGEGIFLRGPGDLCTSSLPCSAEVDTAKDMVDNCAGMMLALISLAMRSNSNNAGVTRSH